MVNFTTDDILLYINGELSAEKATAFENALNDDWSLREKYVTLLEAQKSSFKPIFSPSERTIQNILNYAKKGIKVKVT